MIRSMLMTGRLIAISSVYAKKFRVVDKEFDMIETLYGVGYRFKEQ